MLELEPLRNAPTKDLLNRDWLTDLIVNLGLEAHRGVPAQFEGGLRIWQTPIQFAPYLIALSKLGIRSYVELGVHAGGSLMVTLEYLDRFADRPVRSLAVDMALQDTPVEYLRQRVAATAIQSDTRSHEVEKWLDLYRPDLVFVDADHSEHGCGADCEMASRYARYIGMHDIVDWSCPGPGRVWERFDAPKQAFVDQYDPELQVHGIGLVGPLR